jgi:formylglycine-generating enzyme required for sulfatase activity
MAFAPERDPPPRPAAPLRLTGIVLPVWSARALAALLLAGAVGLPWLATWQGVLRDEPPAGAAASSREVQLRPELVELPGGTFLMGSPPGEAGRSGDENQHPAEVAPFAICRTEVTLGQWEAVMGTRPNKCEYGCAGEHPVQNVSWEDAIRYLNRLTDRENDLRPTAEKLTRCYDEATWAWNRDCNGYRLPTEVEWEYAARAGTKTAYSFGDDPKELCVYANGADQATKRKHSKLAVNDQCDDGHADLAPVGKFKTNGWGLFDMHGNAWEWVWDWYGPYPERSAVGYAGPDVGERRVLRGGSFIDEPWWLRSSLRYWIGPTFSYEYWGFRCVRGSPPSP